MSKSEISKSYNKQKNASDYSSLAMMYFMRTILTGLRASLGKSPEAADYVVTMDLWLLLVIVGVTLLLIVAFSSKNDFSGSLPDEFCKNQNA
ncbi:MAG: hypothetical protein R2875_02315 [Desulfobacterales bacterium]